MSGGDQERRITALEAQCSEQQKSIQTLEKDVLLNRERIRVHRLIIFGAIGATLAAVGTAILSSALNGG